MKQETKENESNCKERTFTYLCVLRTSFLPTHCWPWLMSVQYCPLGGCVLGHSAIGNNWLGIFLGRFCKSNNAHAHYPLQVGLRTVYCAKYFPLRDWTENSLGVFSKTHVRLTLLATLNLLRFAAPRIYVLLQARLIESPQQRCLLSFYWLPLQPLPLNFCVKPLIFGHVIIIFCL